MRQGGLERTRAGIVRRLCADGGSGSHGREDDPDPQPMRYTFQKVNLSTMIFHHIAGYRKSKTKAFIAVRTTSRIGFEERFENSVSKSIRNSRAAIERLSKLS